MKKKLIVAMMTSIMALTLFACGKTEETVAEPANETVEETVEEEPTEEAVTETETEEETVTETVETEETAVEETEEAVDPEVVRKEAAMEKINLVLKAYEELKANETELTRKIVYNVETLEMSFASTDLSEYINEPLKGSHNIYAILIAYYDNYVNKGTGYYDIGDWLKEQESYDSITGVYYDLSTNDSESRTTKMMDAIAFANYLYQADTVELGDVIETTEYTIVNGNSSAYAYPIIRNGEEVDLKAIYDAEGNLLNIIPEKDETYDLMIFTYEK